MALTRDRNIKDIPARISYYGSGGGASMQSLDHASSLELLGYKGASNMSMLVDGDASDTLGSCSGSFIPVLSDPSNSASSSYMFGAANSLTEEARPVGPWMAGSSSLLSFDQGGEHTAGAGFVGLDHEDESALLIDAMDQNYQMSYLDHHTKYGAADQHSSRLIHQDQSCFEIASGGYGLSTAAWMDKRCEDDRFGLLYPGATVFDRSVVQECIGQSKGPGQKRPCKDGDLQLPSPKKQCPANRKSKGQHSPSNKDPQSLAAKNRRERISERLKVLQDLVPNGTKVDMVTMLEKAITYVKFLQLQVKVLATDDFWPAQGGKAPELSQVKEAIDAILCSQREKTPSLKK